MSSHSDENLIDIFKALSHPLRQEIIEILANYQQIGYTNLQIELNRDPTKKKIVQVGTIYHHIGLLGDLVIQNENTKTWSLSDRGWIAHNLLTNSQNGKTYLEKGDQFKPTFLTFIWKIFAPSKLFLIAKESLILFTGWLIIFLAFFGFITSDTGLILVFVFFNEGNPTKQIWISLGSIILSWITFTLLILLLSKKMIPSRRIVFQDLITLFVFLGIALLPLTIFPIIMKIGLFTLNQKIFPLTLATLLQLWVILLTARGLSVLFFIRMDQAGLISLIATYLMVILGLILGF